MNKVILLLLFAISIVGINSEFKLCEEVSSSELEGYDDDDDRGEYCRIHSTNPDFTHCCYIEGDNLPNGNKCYEINDDAYENIKRYKSFLKQTYSGIKIKCSSQFLTYSLFALLVLLF